MEAIINDIELFCQENTIPHRFVGGVSYGGLLCADTTWKIDITHRQIFLYRNNKLSLIRSDHTFRDIDILLITEDTNKKKLLQKYIISLKKKYKLFPLISIETIIQKNKLNKLLQFVTALIEDNDNLYLCFGNEQEVISQQSLEPWTVYLDDKTSFTTRNPIADFYAYQFRSPSGIKKKDKEKVVLLQKLANTLISEGKIHGIDYLSGIYFRSWEKFISSLQHTTNFQTQGKKFFMQLYWSTIGEYLAHGKGISKYITFLQNKFTG